MHLLNKKSRISIYHNVDFTKQQSASIVQLLNKKQKFDIPQRWIHKAKPAYREASQPQTRETNQQHQHYNDLCYNHKTNLKTRTKKLIHWKPQLNHHTRRQRPQPRQIHTEGILTPTNNHKKQHLHNNNKKGKKQNCL